MVTTGYEAQLNQSSVLDLFYPNILRHAYRVFFVLIKLNFTNVYKIKETILNCTNWIKVIHKLNYQFMNKPGEIIHSSNQYFGSDWAMSMS